MRRGALQLAAGAARMRVLTVAPRSGFDKSGEVCYCITKHVINPLRVVTSMLSTGIVTTIVLIIVLLGILLQEPMPVGRKLSS